MMAVDIVIVCFVAGYWLVMKLMSANGTKSFEESMRDPGQRRATPAPAATDGLETATLANWHLILGVDANATREEVKTAYKRQMSLHHPDKVAQMGEGIRALAEAKAKQINAAHDIAVRYGYG